MLLAYVLVFLHLSASTTCYATSRNPHLLFAGRAGDGGTAPLPAMIVHHHHQHRHIAKVLSDYNLHYRPAMMARQEGPPSPSVEAAAGGGGALPPPPPSLSAVEPTRPSGGVEGVPPPPPGKQDTSAAMEPSPSPMPSSPGGEGASSSSESASGTGQEESAASDDVGVDYEGPKTHPPSHN